MAKNRSEGYPVSHGGAKIDSVKHSKRSVKTKKSGTKRAVKHPVEALRVSNWFQKGPISHSYLFHPVEALPFSRSYLLEIPPSDRLKRGHSVLVRVPNYWNLRGTKVCRRPLQFSANCVPQIMAGLTLQFNKIQHSYAKLIWNMVRRKNLCCVYVGQNGEP